MSTILIFIMSMFLCANAKSKTPEALLQALDQNYDSIKDDLLADLKKYLNQQEEKDKEIQAEVKALVEDYDSIEKRVNAESNKVHAISKAVKEVPECETRVDNLKKDDEQLEVDAKKALDCCYAKFSTTKKPTTTTPHGKVCWDDFKEKVICAGGIITHKELSLNVNASEEELNLGAPVIIVCPLQYAQVSVGATYVMDFAGFTDYIGGTMLFEYYKDPDCNPRHTWARIKCGNKGGVLNVTKATQPDKCFYDVDMQYPCDC